MKINKFLSIFCALALGGWNVSSDWAYESSWDIATMNAWLLAWSKTILAFLTIHWQWVILFLLVIAILAMFKLSD